MSRTLFWYVFADLLRIFALASGALSGIMSFGGLLRPLTEYGLTADQVLKVLAYSSPAMSTYSLPVAALFATTMVYGRLTSDNEITGMKSAGIGYLSIWMPAIILGLLSALTSLLLLSFVVPSFSLKVEKVVFSNLGEMVASSIQRTRQIRFDRDRTPITVLAQSAYTLDPDPDRPDDQAVVLVAPMIVLSERINVEDGRLQVPTEFFTASAATAFIRQDNEGEVSLSVRLDQGTKFPRRVTGRQRAGTEVSISTTSFGPVAIDSVLQENTKFMDIRRLRELSENPQLSKRVRRELVTFVQRDQEEEYLRLIMEGLQSPAAAFRFDAGAESYRLLRGGSQMRMEAGKLILDAGDDPEADPIRFVQISRDRALDVAAREARIRARPDRAEARMYLEVELIDALVRVGDETSQRGVFPRGFSVPMPASIRQIESRTARDYLTSEQTRPEQRKKLLREVVKLHNSITAEMHARLSFAVSCFALVMVGCALGMMFKSGNFLSAFAVSVIPALICTALIVTGQHAGENVPERLSEKDWMASLKLGLMLIWSGNVAVSLIGAVLLGWLRRQ
jgi:lipopolysaccharide export LptBFGC system permease protein LptF